jgi:hypothetical protein
MTDERGGQVLKTGKIGRVNCIRQQLMMPGENINISIKGQAKLETLRERDSLRINAHLGIFITPLRWLWANFPTYLREGPGTSQNPVVSTTWDLSRYGLGSFVGANVNMHNFWYQNVRRVYNEWYKWPENEDVGTWGIDGEPAVPLQHSWSRTRFNVDPSPEDYEAPVAGNTLDVRDLAKAHGRFKAAMERDILTYNRYMELVKEAYNANGSREVDQVPIMVDQVEVGVNPRQISATDGASLGQYSSMFDFGIDHQVQGVTAPEHSVLSYFLTIRFAPIIEGRHPLSNPDYLDWEDFVGDPQILGESAPKEVNLGAVAALPNNVPLGYAAAGWQWRSGHDTIGKRIEGRNSFPYMKTPMTQAETKDATRVQQAFRSQSLGDYTVDCFISEKSRNLLNTPLESYFVGLKGDGNKAEYPKQGKML